MSDFKNEVVVVTGASSGIGRATAVAFAEAGANLVLAARREDRIRALASELRGFGVQAEGLRCDVTQPKDVAALARRVGERFGKVDVLVNNAGVGLYGPLEAITDELLRKVFEVNVFGTHRVTRELLPWVRKAKAARIINVSSVLGHRGLPMLGGYCASKAALNSLTETLRVELRAEGVSVLLVSPGLTESEFRDHRLSPEGYEQERIPFRAMTAEHVAKVILDAAAKRKRETVLTLLGRAMVYGNRFVPALFDRVARRMVGKPGGRS